MAVTNSSSQTKIKEESPVDLRDVLTLIGVGLIGLGLGLISLPLVPIWIGTVILVGVWMDLRGSSEPPPK